MILRERITLGDLTTLAEQRFGDLVKVVVDVERGIMSVGGELHADEEAELLQDGSRQGALWGINLYPADHGTPDWLEYDSMINVRPSVGNRTRSVDDPSVRDLIAAIVSKVVVA